MDTPDTTLRSLVRVRLPPTHAAHIGGLRSLQVAANTVGEALRVTTTQYPALEALIWRDVLTLNPVVMVFHNDELVRENGLNLSVREGDTVDVVPAVESG